MTPPVSSVPTLPVSTGPVSTGPVSTGSRSAARVPDRALADLLLDALDAAGAPGGAPETLGALATARPVDRRDRFLTLLAIYDLHTAPIETLGERVRCQGAPEVAALKQRLEQEWLGELDEAWSEAGTLSDADDVERVVHAMRAIAARDRLPAAYRWLAKQAGWSEVVDFLALEGGPDGGFDDLVAVCQVGLRGSAKLELGKNYWDEMGQGDAAGVHTVLHDDLVAAVDMPRIPREEQPVEALERAALAGLLATNRWLQPEMIGALGLLELQAGPRCRLVLQAFDRLGAPQGAYPFYVEHAEVDPIHGKDWMEKAVVPLVAERPEWGPRIVKGAWWRSTINLRFFESLRAQLVGERSAAA
ncbi:MAG: iron-containing redox enzyme family protein [Actinomycetota bacterium]|nr:iron-containing redox enzyme family protein [Actinomycetota bacterium]